MASFKVWKSFPKGCRTLQLDYRCARSMKKLATLVFVVSAVVLFLSGCAFWGGPSPEERANELERQRQAEKQQAEFRKGLPPVTNPGQDQ
jgi:hypothetical protein